MDYVLGVTCLNDVTARELQAKDVQYSRAKGFDTFAPIGPCIAVGLDPSALDVEGWVNAETAPEVEHARADLPGAVSRRARLAVHDARIRATSSPTGTPSGVGPLQPGDRVMVKVQGVGTLGNPCVAG